MTYSRCDGCQDWFHGDCVEPRVLEHQASLYLTYHCPQCTPTLGPSQLKYPPRTSLREKEKVNYKVLSEGEEGNEHKYTDILSSRTFLPHSFPILSGSELTVDYIKTNGLKTPILIPLADGLGMSMPTSDLTVRQVAESCGLNKQVEVLQVSTQSELTMTLREWADYFELHPSQRERLLNVITLEISQSSLGKSIVRPRLVCDLDWIDHVWPKHVKMVQYPQVQLYCLMSVKDSFTDFHIDFGGTSVFYHLISGQKQFYFIEPTEKNLKKYEKWSSSPHQATQFFADMVPECVQVNLSAGQTQIHAVYTPSDSIVIGGNFLHGYDIAGQLRIYDIENKTQVPPKFRFPYYETMMWYAAHHYTLLITKTPDLLTHYEMKGFPALVSHLKQCMAYIHGTQECAEEERLRLLESIPESFDGDLVLEMFEKAVSVEWKKRQQVYPEMYPVEAKSKKRKRVSQPKCTE